MQQRLSAFELGVVFLLVGCSMFNREGPNVTCTDLDNGAQNACSNGIIATCTVGKVTYEVCDLQTTCEQTWQTQGQYRCDQNSQLPNLTGSGGNGGLATGTGGAWNLSYGGTGGATNTGGATSIPGNGGQTGCGSGPCAIGSTGNSTVDAIAIDTQNVYFSDCTTLWSIPKSGGFSTTLSSQLTGCSYGQMATDGQYVDLVESKSGTSQITRNATSGGGREIIVDQIPYTNFPIVVAGGNVFWAPTLTPFSLQYTNLSTKAAGTAAANVSVGTRLVVSNASIFWCSGRTVSMLPIAGPFPASPSSMSITDRCDDFDMASDGAIAYVSTRDQAIGIVLPLTTTDRILTSGQAVYRAVAVDSSNVFYSFDSGNSDPTGNSGNNEIWKVARSGGAVTKIAAAGYGAQRILVDDTSLYWFAGSNVMKAAK